MLISFLGFLRPQALSLFLDWCPNLVYKPSTTTMIRNGQCRSNQVDERKLMIQSVIAGLPGNRKELIGMRAKSRSISSQHDGMRWLWVFSKYCNEILEDIIGKVETINFPICNQNLDHPSSEYICFHLILRAAGTRLHQKQESSVCLGRDYWWHGIVDPVRLPCVTPKNTRESYNLV